MKKILAFVRPIKLSLAQNIMQLLLVDKFKGKWWHEYRIKWKWKLSGKSICFFQLSICIGWLLKKPYLLDGPKYFMHSIILPFSNKKWEHSGWKTKDICN